MTDNEKAKRGIRARQDAIKSLIEAHAEEFQEMVESNRLALGLPRTPNAEPPDVLEKKLRDAEAKAEKLRRELEQAQGDAVATNRRR